MDRNLEGSDGKEDVGLGNCAEHRNSRYISPCDQSEMRLIGEGCVHGTTERQILGLTAGYIEDVVIA